MPQNNWDWNPIPRTRRSRSRPAPQLVETIQVIRTTTTEGVDIFAPFKAIAANRQNQRFGRRPRLSQPIDWFDDMNITVSSEDSIESNGSEGQENIMTSTPRNTSKALMSSQTPNASNTSKTSNTSITTQTNDCLQNQSLEKGREVDANTEYIDALDGNTSAINTTERREAEAEKITENLGRSQDNYDPNVDSDENEVQSGRESPQLSDANGLRRSKRNRMHRLEYWRGQRAVYKRDSTGVTEKIVAINEGSKLYNYRPNKTKATKRKNGNQEKRTKAINVFDLSIHKKVKINGENRDSLNVMSLESLDWKESGQSPGVYISTVNKNKTKGDALGMLKFADLAEKKKSKTGDYVTHLTVIYGVLTLTIGESSQQMIRTGDYYKVSSNTNYSISNLREDIAYISFTVSKQ